MRTTKHLVLAVAVGLALFGVPAPPAVAATQGTAEFLATLTLPATGLPMVNGATNGPTGIQSSTCHGAATGKMATTGGCSVTGTGLGVSSCGLGTGQLKGTLLLANNSAVAFHINYTIMGAAFYATGSAGWGTQTGIMTVEGTVAPTVGTTVPPQCVTGTQSQFTLVATATWETM